jgi:hypothetical protein
LIAGNVTIAGVTHAFVGTSSGFELIDVPGATFTAGQAINNAGQVSGLYDDALATHGFIATPAALPTGTTASGAYTFSVDVVPNTPIFIDPPVAVGYDYTIGKDDPAFASVRLPIGIGDSLYLLVAEGRRFTLAGGVSFDFRANGFKNGVKKFRVACIEGAAALDPANAQAFPTGLTFLDAGRFTGTQQPLTDPAHGPSLCARETIGP